MRKLLEEEKTTLEEEEEMISSLQKETDTAHIESKDLLKSVKDLKAQLKGNMSLVEAKTMIWSEIIKEVKDHGKYITLVNDKKNAIHDFKVQLDVGCREGNENVLIVWGYIQFINELPIKELGMCGVVNHF